MVSRFFLTFFIFLGLWKLVKQYLGYFPWIQLSATVSPITRTVLKVDLLISSDYIWKDRFHGAAQRWWILVEDTENDHIYHSELFTLTKKMARAEPQKLSFTVPIFEPHPPQYYIRAVSDSWLYAEAFYTISFQNLKLPEARTTHTELLDLKPLPVTSLANSTYESLYNFSHFNPIQTQIFHVLYYTDNNVLLGTPTGSRKTISTEFAMLHLFNTQPEMKVIYIAPLKAIVRERMHDWRKRCVSKLGKEMVEMTGDYTPDLMALLSADIIISTPEKWDGISRNWHSRKWDEIHLLGADRGSILELKERLYLYLERGSGTTPFRARRLTPLCIPTKIRSTRRETQFRTAAESSDLSTKEIRGISVDCVGGNLPKLGR
ncbi:hypothetical protein V6N13_013263 [Hibiscus sabdariffa]